MGSPAYTFDYDKANYCVYLPSLQKGYSQFAVEPNKAVRDGELPKGLNVNDLNFFRQDSKLWSCRYALYSCGQFDRALIEKNDMCAYQRGDGVVIGDSGGFQLGSGAISNKQEKQHLQRFQLQPEQQFARWKDCGFRERTLLWLEQYTDYAMTLDMVLWAREGVPNPFNAKSPLRKLSNQQLIDLSVDNLKYFADNRGKFSSSTKYLNVLQDIGHGTGMQWYEAVKDFDFEGWAFGSETKNTLFAACWWCRKLLDDGKLDNAEWIHMLGCSPIIKQIIFTAIQRSLRKVLGTRITLSLDSSSPIQIASVASSYVLRNEFTSDLGTWKISSELIPENLETARRRTDVSLPDFTPHSHILDWADIIYRDGLYDDTRRDALSYFLVENLNMYMFHHNGWKAHDLVFNSRKSCDVPPEIADAVGLVEEYFSVENVRDFESKKLQKVMQSLGDSAVDESSIDLAR